MKALILVCTVFIQQCDSHNAIDVMVFPVEARTPGQCLIEAQQHLARMPILVEGASVKVACKGDHR